MMINVELVSIVFDGINVLISLGVLYLAWRGLKTWKESQDYSNEQDFKKELLQVYLATKKYYDMVIFEYKFASMFATEKKLLQDDSKETLSSLARYLDAMKGHLAARKDDLDEVPNFIEEAKVIIATMMLRQTSELYLTSVRLENILAIIKGGYDTLGYFQSKRYSSWNDEELIKVQKQLSPESIDEVTSSCEETFNKLEEDIPKFYKTRS